MEKLIKILGWIGAGLLLVIWTLCVIACSKLKEAVSVNYGDYWAVGTYAILYFFISMILIVPFYLLAINMIDGKYKKWAEKVNDWLYFKIVAIMKKNRRYLEYKEKRDAASKSKPTTNDAIAAMLRQAEDFEKEKCTENDYRLMEKDSVVVVDECMIIQCVNNKLPIYIVTTAYEMARIVFNIRLKLNIRLEYKPLTPRKVKGENMYLFYVHQQCVTDEITINIQSPDVLREAEPNV